MKNLTKILLLGAMVSVTPILSQAIAHDSGGGMMMRKSGQMRTPMGDGKKMMHHGGGDRQMMMQGRSMHGDMHGMKSRSHAMRHSKGHRKGHGAMRVKPASIDGAEILRFDSNVVHGPAEGAVYVAHVQHNQVIRVNLQNRPS